MFTLPASIEDEREIDEDDEHYIQFVGSREDAPETSKTAEQSFHFVLPFVPFPTVSPRFKAPALWQHNGVDVRPTLSLRLPRNAWQEGGSVPSGSAPPKNGACESHGTPLPHSIKRHTNAGPSNLHGPFASISSLIRDIAEAKGAEPYGHWSLTSFPR